MNNSHTTETAIFEQIAEKLETRKRLQEEYVRLARQAETKHSAQPRYTEEISQLSRELRCLEQTYVELRKDYEHDLVDQACREEDMIGHFRVVSFF
jgi:ABC-type phosphate transport system auxiliary subunit